MTVATGSANGFSLRPAVCSASRPLRHVHQNNARRSDARGRDARRSDARGRDARRSDARGRDARHLWLASDIVTPTLFFFALFNSFARPLFTSPHPLFPSSRLPLLSLPPVPLAIPWCVPWFFSFFLTV